MKTDSDKQYEICKEACINSGCRIPTKEEFLQVVANTPAFIMSYFFLCGQIEQLNSQQTPLSHSHREKHKGRKVSEKVVASRIGENILPDVDVKLKTKWGRTYVK